MLTGLPSKRVTLAADGQVGRVGRIEELRDALVSERVAQAFAFDEGALGVRRVVARGNLLVVGRQRAGVLVLDRVLSDHFDDVIAVTAAGTFAAHPTHHATRRPRLVRSLTIPAMPVGDDEVCP